MKTKQRKQYKLRWYNYADKKILIYLRVVPSSNVFEILEIDFNQLFQMIESPEIQQCMIIGNVEVDDKWTNNEIFYDLQA